MKCVSDLCAASDRIMDPVLESRARVGLGEILPKYGEILPKYAEATHRGPSS